MIYVNNNHYMAEEGHTIIRKSDSFDMGDEIWIGINDSIENYEERECLDKDELFF